MMVAYPEQGRGGFRVCRCSGDGGRFSSVTARRLSLPEVGGDAVKYTEPDVDGIAATLAALIDDPDRQGGVEPFSGFEREARRVHLGGVGDRPRQGAYERAAAEVSV